MFALEGAAMCGIILGLFRARTVLGLTPLYIVLGGFQFLEATLNLRAEIAPGFFVYPASAVLFPTTLVTVLMIYVKEDAIEARKLVYGLVLANACVSLVSLLIGWHIALPGSTSPDLASRLFRQSAWVSMAGTTLLFLDVIGIILTFEFVSRFTRGLLARLFLSLVAILAFDQLFFSLLVPGTSLDFLTKMLHGLAGKAVAAALYSVGAWAYLRFGEPHTATAGTGDVADVFQTLTYRQKYEQARQRMVRDGLTGLYNRGYFDEALPQALAHARRHNESLSVLIIDTDHFKTINDQYSHMEGDAALRVIGDTLLSEVRPSDVPCRYGGDEFVVMLSCAGAEAAQAFAKRFRDALQTRCRLASPPFPWGYVTTTIGIATFPVDDDPAAPIDLMRIADRRLYLGKQAGRDTVVSPGQDLEPSSWQAAGTA